MFLLSPACHRPQTEASMWVCVWGCARESASGGGVGCVLTYERLYILIVCGRFGLVLNLVSFFFVHLYTMFVCLFVCLFSCMFISRSCLSLLCMLL